MIWSRGLTVEPGTTREDPSVVVATLPTSTIRQCVVYFPPGCLGYVHAVISHLEHQIIPIDPESSIQGDDWAFDCPLVYPLTDGVNRVQIRAWNTGTTYPHTLSVYLYLEPPSSVDPSELLKQLFLGQMGELPPV